MMKISWDNKRKRLREPYGSPVLRVSVPYRGTSPRVPKERICFHLCLKRVYSIYKTVGVLQCNKGCYRAESTFGSLGESVSLHRAQEPFCWRAFPCPQFTAVESRYTNLTDSLKKIF